ncbi:hypothetical protein [Streptomyces pratensis]|uniref:hypothetical protein n=1 Tax=Streptomyces pratensis TaxID=1169025 RepID=UPI003019CFC6
MYAPHAPSVTSAKGVLGHTMGAAGAIEAALRVLTVARGTAVPTADFAEPDDTTAGIDVVRATARPQPVRPALSHSLGLGGHNTVPAFTAPRAHGTDPAPVRAERADARSRPLVEGRGPRRVLQATGTGPCHAPATRQRPGGGGVRPACRAREGEARLPVPGPAPPS